MRRVPKMLKVQCPNLRKGENVHKHSCGCCGGRQHIPFSTALKYLLRGLLVLSDGGHRDATDDEMFDRIDRTIDGYKKKYGFTGHVSYEYIRLGEPISTLNACIRTLRFYT